MGYKSTYRITREDCLAEIMRHLLGATDQELENALEALIGERKCMNFLIASAEEKKSGAEPWDGNAPWYTH